ATPRAHSNARRTGRRSDRTRQEALKAILRKAPAPRRPVALAVFPRRRRRVGLARPRRGPQDAPPLPAPPAGWPDRQRRAAAWAAVWQFRRDSCLRLPGAPGDALVARRAARSEAPTDSSPWRRLLRSRTCSAAGGTRRWNA